MNLKIKLIIYSVVIVIVGLLISTIGILTKKVSNLNHSLEMAENNVRAYTLENSELKNKNIEFQFTVNQLNASTDSLVIEMNKVRKQLKIKDKNIERLEYLLSTATKKDTVVFKDTIFTEKVSHIDTTIQDSNNWYKCTIGLEYPNTISVAPEFKSEKYIITSWHKETIKAPKKTKFARFFQKKMKVLEVEVVEKNPYIDSNKQKFIEIKK